VTLSTSGQALIQALLLAAPALVLLIHSSARRSQADRFNARMKPNLRFAVELGSYLLLLTAAAILLWTEASQAGLPPESLRVLWTMLGAALAAMLVAPIYPLAGPLAFVGLFYLFPRERDITETLANIGALSWVATLSLVAAVIWARRRDLDVRPADSRLVRAAVHFSAWLGVCLAVALLRGGPIDPYVVERSGRYLQAFAIFGAVFVCRPSLIECRAVALALGVMLIARGQWLAPQWHLEQNLAMVTAVLFAFAAGVTAARPLSLYQVVLVPVVVYLGWSIVMIQNRGGLLGLVAGCVALMWTKRERWWWIAAPVPFVLIAWWASSQGLLRRFAQIYVEGRFVGSAGERLQIWAGGLDIAREHWLFGVGPGNFAVYRGLYSHNSLVELLVETGIVGVVLYLAMFVAAYRTIRPALAGGDAAERAIARGVLAAMAAHLVAGLFLSNAPLVLSYVWLGVAASLRIAIGSRNHRRDAADAELVASV
jgi:O-antigen ligase